MGYPTSDTINGVLVTGILGGVSGAVSIGYMKFWNAYYKNDGTLINQFISIGLVLILVIGVLFSLLGAFQVGDLCPGQHKSLAFPIGIFLLFTGAVLGTVEM